MNSKVSKYLIRIVLILLVLSVVGVTLFLFLYQSELLVEFSRLLWDLFISVHLPH